MEDSRYAPSKRSSMEDESFVSDETLLEKDYNLPGPRRSLRKETILYIVNISFLIFNACLLAAILPLLAKHDSDDVGFDSLWSPANEAIKYETRTFNTSLYAKNKYNGEVRNESIIAWYDLLQPDSIVLSSADLQRLNRTSVAIPGREDSYLGGIGYAHHLHCLNYLRMNLYRDHYKIGEDEHTVRLHISHCIDNLRTWIQCQGDVSILTYSWRPDYLKPWPDFQIEHRCRNFDALAQWTRDHELDFAQVKWHNPIFQWDKYDPHEAIPTKYDDTTELVGGTRENPRVLKLAGGDAY